MAIPDNALLVNNVAGLDSAPRAVVDKGGTASGLQVSTQLTRATGALEVQPAPGATGGGSYDCLCLGNRETGDAGSITAARADPSKTPFFTFVGYDGGATRTIYFGGGGWGVPDANEISFYTDPDNTANAAPDGGYLRFFIGKDGYCGFGQYGQQAGIRLICWAVEDTTVPLAVSRSGSMTADMFQFLDSDGTTVMAAFAKNGEWKPPTLADAAAENKTVFIGSDHSNKLCFKDGGGTVTPLH